MYEPTADVRSPSTQVGSAGARSRLLPVSHGFFPPTRRGLLNLSQCRTLSLEPPNTGRPLMLGRESGKVTWDSQRRQGRAHLWENSAPALQARPLPHREELKWGTRGAIGSVFRAGVKPLGKGTKRPRASGNPPKPPEDIRGDCRGEKKEYAGVQVLWWAQSCRVS